MKVINAARIEGSLGIGWNTFSLPPSSCLTPRNDAATSISPPEIK